MKYFDFKKVLLLFFLALILTSIKTDLSAQACPYDNTQFGTSAAPTVIGLETTLTTGIWGGEFRRITCMEAGATYGIYTCEDFDFDTELSVYPAGGGGFLVENDDFCGTQSHVLFTPTTTGDYDVLVDLFPCANNTVGMTLKIKKLTEGNLSCLATTSVSTTPESCPGANDGSVTLTVTKTPGCLDFCDTPFGFFLSNTGGQIDSGTNISSITFNGLAAGSHLIDVLNNGLGGAGIANQSFNIPVTPDVTDPAITCPVDILETNGATLCGKSVVYIAPVGTDNCPGATTTLTAGLASGAFHPVGVTTNTYTVTDGSANVASCSFTVTVLDVEDPAITCPGNITVPNDGGSCSAVVVYGAPTGTDNCTPTTTLTGGIGSGGTFNVGTTTETYTVTDGVNTDQSCSFDVIVNDTENPTMNCPGDQIANTNPGSCVATVSYAGPTGVNDNCGVAGFPTNDFNGTGSANGDYPLGLTTVVWSVDDINGNNFTCSHTVTVTDNENPVISCPSDVNVGFDPGTCASTVTYTAPVGTDNCSATTTLTGGIGSGGPFPPGTTVEEYTVSDGTNTAVCSFNVNVTDDGAFFTWSAIGLDVTFTDASTAPGIVSWSWDFGDGSPLSPLQNPVHSYGVAAAYTVCLTINNGCGVSQYCELIPLVCIPPSVDTEPVDQDICISEDAVYTVLASGTNLTYQWQESIGGGPFNNMLGENANSLTIPNVAAVDNGNQYVCNITGLCGSVSSVIVNLIVDDITPPVITCPGDITQANDPGECEADIFYVVPVGTDDCPSPTTVLSAGINSGDPVPVGVPTTVEYTVTDLAGNPSTCSFLVTVNDNENPAITCPNDTILSTDPGACDALFNYTAPIGTDNCPGSNTIQTAGLGNGSAFPIGTTTETYEVTDAVALVATCSFNVTVNDTQAPFISCPADITVDNDNGGCDAVVAFVSPTSLFDNCPGVTNAQTGGLASGLAFPVGVTTNVFTATDALGLTSSCSFDVTVNDTSLPTITCPVDVTLNTDPAICTRVYSYTVPTTDNCPGETVVQDLGIPSGGVFPQGPTFNQFTVTDGGGNVASCTFTVTVEDNELPVIACPPDTFVFNIPTQCDANITLPLPGASDNCGILLGTPYNSYNGTFDASDNYPGGTTVVTWYIEDVNGNQDSCNQNVIVVDNEDPIILCPGTIAANNTTDSCNAVVSFPDPLILDNCPAPVLTQTSGLPSGSDFPVGITLNVFTATDVSGNTAVCLFTIDVTDAQNPTITCPNDTIVPNDPTLCQTFVNYSTPVGADNCPGPNTTQTSGQASGSLFGLGVNNQVYKVTDAAGLTATCSFTITVVDTQAPVITCPADITTPVDPGLCTANVTYTDPVGNDNCFLGFYTTQTGGLGSGANFPAGTNVEEFTVTDTAGLTAVCTFNIIVTETTLPVITCPADVTIDNDFDQCDAVYSYTVPVGTDNCPGVVTTQTLGIGSGSNFPLGTTTEEYTATDAALNVATCSFTITVADTQHPMIVCPNDTTINNDVGSCDASFSYTAPVGTDNCPGQSTILASGLGSGSIFPLGVSNEIYSVSDAGGLTASCSFSITVADTQAPTITCPANIVQPNDPGTCDALVTIAIPTNGDNCSVAAGSPTNNFNGGTDASDTYPMDTTWVTYTVMDDAANMANCMFYVVVQDTQLPVINCPADASVSNDPGTCEAVYTYTVPVGTDNCPGEVTSQTAGLGTGSAFPVGATTESFEVIDNAGNLANCSFTVTVTDDELPMISCPNDTTLGNGPGNCSLVYTYMAPIGMDNCPGQVTILSSGLGSGATFPIGPATTEVYEVTDLAGNTATCSFSVTVVDTQAPALSCPADITVSNDPGVCTAIVFFLNPLPTDNCPGVTNGQTAGLPSGSAFLLDSTKIVYTAQDLIGNTSSCSFWIIVEDNEDPTIACPGNITVGNDAGSCDAVVTYSAPVGADNCAGSVTTLSSGIGSGGLFPLGTSTEAYEVIDGAGNTAACSFDIIVNDNEDPTITCPTDASIYTDPGVCTAVYTYTAPVGMDNCPGASTAQTAGLGSGSSFPVGTTTETYEVTDAVALNANCSFTVTVMDTVKPVASCPADMSVNNTPGLCDAPVTYTAPTATDNCGIASVNLLTGLGSGSNFPVNSSTEVYEATDINGNTSTCSFVITVVDLEIPVITCPADVNVDNDPGNCDAVVNFTPPTATDNCAGTTITLASGIPNGGNFPVGTTTEVYDAQDIYGNIASCSFTVTVSDTQSPMIVCPANTTINNDLGLCSAVYVFTPPVGTDNCPGSTTIQTSGLVSGSPFAVGVMNQSYMVTDAASNTATCSFTITVVDVEAPVITCPTDFLLTANPGTCAAVLAFTAPSTLGDNCGGVTSLQTAGLSSGASFPVGTTTNTFEATDAVGLTASCSFDVVVTDDELPVIICPADIFVSNDLGNCNAMVNYPAPSGTDNCPGQITNLVAGLGDGGTFPIGTTTETYEVVDNSGNLAACSFTITVNDDEAPSITCPTNISQPADLGVCETIITYTPPTGTDNCPGVSTSSTGGLGSGATFPVGITSESFITTDAAGNTATCAFNITVADTQDPIITCPADISVPNDPGVCTAIVNYSAPVTLSDNCGGVTAVQTGGIFSGSPFPNSVVTNTFKATDASGNTATCSFTVTVNDVTPPAITCPFNITQNSDPGSCDATIAFLAPTASDNCPAPSVALSSGLPSGSLFPVGITTNVYTATDGGGNTATCSFNITINDNEDPVVTCPADVNTNADPGACDVLLSIPLPTASDNCMIDPAATMNDFNATNDASGLYPTGSTAVEFSVADMNGNTATCNFTVLVTDVEVPSIACPLDVVTNNDPGSCDATVTIPAPTSSDNCGVIAGTPINDYNSTTDASGSYSSGTTTVTWTVEDVNGNTNSCSLDITVNDTEAPTITCPADFTLSNDPGDCGAVVTYSASTSDNCPGETISLLAGLGSGSLFGIGSNTEVLQVTDGAGLTSTCSFSVIVSDDEAPVLPCPANVVTSVTPGNCGAFVNYTTPVGTDNCPGVATTQDAGLGSGSLFPVGITTESYSTIDLSGNNALCSFTIEVLDPLPVISFSGLTDPKCTTEPADVLTGIPTGGAFSGPGVSGNLFNAASAGAGTHSVIYTYVDGNGCTGADTQTVTVIDPPPASITGLGTTYCQTDPSVTLTGSPAGGAFTGPGMVGSVFNPILAGPGPHTITYTVGSLCISSVNVNTVVFPAPSVVFIGLAAEYCADENPSLLSGAPAGGTFSGAGVVGNTFDPALAGPGSHDVTYSFTDINGCSAATILSTVVHPLPLPTFSGLNSDYCEDATTVTLTGSPTGGTFSGPGVSGTSFSPAIAGVGTHIIMYDYTDGNGCSNSAAISTNVHALPLVGLSGLATDYCIDAAAVTMTGSPLGGSFSGPGISGNVFNPAFAGVGAHTLNYTFTDINGCTNTASQIVNVHGLPVVNFSGLPTSNCLDATPSTLTGVPVGGTFTGTGVSGNSFEPAVAGVGTHSVTYTYTDANGCTNSVSKSITVNPLPVASFFGLATDYCVDASTSTLVGIPGPGVFTGAGISGNTFNPAVAGAGTFDILFTFTDVNGCVNTETQTTTVHPLPLPSFSGLNAEYCLEDAATALTGSPLGGTFSGSGVSGGSFFPALAGVGTHVINYVYTDGFGCTNNSSQTVVVHPMPIVTFTGLDAQYCEDAGGITLVGSPTGGTFTGPGISGSNFAPSVAGPGTHDITYSFTDVNGCSNDHVKSVVVNPLPVVSFTGLAPEYCESDDAVTLAATPTGGTFGGSGISGNDFDAADAGVGTHTVTYTYTDANGCINSVSQAVVVHALPVVSFSGLGSEYCEDDGSVSLTGTPAGGTFSGSGILAGDFSPADAGVGSHTITYTYSDLNGCENIANQVVTVHALPMPTYTGLNLSYCIDAATAVLTGAPTGGTFSGPGIVGNSFVASTAGLGTHSVVYTYTDINGCTNSVAQNVTVHPLPVVSIDNLDTEYCENEATVVLSATPAGGTFSGAGISGNSFDPSDAGLGMHAITYTYMDVNGCTGTISANVEILELPTPSFNGLNSSYCVNDVPSTLTGSPTGGTFSGTGVSGTLFIPSTAGVGSHSVTYTYTNADGCTATVTQTTTVFDSPNPFLTGLSSSYCEGDGVAFLSGFPFGGVFDGPGVVGNTFDPGATGAGSFNISYIYTDGNGCEGTATQSVIVHQLPAVSLTGLNAAYCTDNAPISMTGTPTGGFYSGPGVIGNQFDPSIPGAGAHNLTYTFTNANGCTNSAVVSVTVHNLPTLSFSGLNQDYCLGDNASNLVASPVGGVFSGSGVVGNAFDPSIAGAGSHNVVYNFTDGNGCSNDASQFTEVFDLPEVLLQGLSTEYCENEPSVQMSGDPAGGFFTGNGVTGTMFNPGSAGPGIHTITYSYTDGNGCSGATTSELEVFSAPDAIFSGLGQNYCTDDGSVTLTGIPAGGLFSGAGVEGNTFNPATAGAGQHTITYTYQSENGCTDVTTQTTTVNNIPAVGLSGLAPAYCITEDAVLLNVFPTGGILSGNGVTGNFFDPAAAGPGLHEITYTFQNANGCTNTATQITDVNDLPVVNLGADQILCGGDSLVLDAGNVGAQYLWSTGAVTQTLTVTQGGTYSVTVTTGTGCQSSDAMNLQVDNLKPIAVDPGNCPTFTFSTGTTSNASTTWNWDFGDGTSISGGSVISHTYSSDGTFTVIARGTNDCGVREVTTSVTVNCVVGVTPSLVVGEINVYPNPVETDLFIEMKGENLRDARVMIYDQSGKLVFDRVLRTVNGQQTIEVDVRDYADGVYYVKGYLNGTEIVKKIVKM